jgi:H+/Cl- antiporter ClcA
MAETRRTGGICGVRLRPRSMCPRLGTRRSGRTAICVTTVTSTGAPPVDPNTLLRSRDYLRLLGLAAAIGLPISAVAYAFLTLVHYLQHWVFEDLPHGLGFHEVPAWWPLPVLGLAGILVGLVIRYLPGGGGHSPAHGFQPGGRPDPRHLPGVVVAAVVGLGLGVVLGPEAPLIAMGGGLAVLALGRGQAARPPQVVAVVAAAGSFAAIATLLGSPLVGAFLLMEAVGIGGPALGMVLVPGLLSAGIGALIFLGLGRWTGLGTFSLSVPNLPPVPALTLGQLGWAVVIGAIATVLGTGIRHAALRLEPVARQHVMLVTPMMGVVIAALALVYAQITGHSTADVLYSGQTQLGPLLQDSATYSFGALILLLVCKSLAYTAALGSFRGGPIFPAAFLGAAVGVALSHLPGLPVLAGASMGIAAMTVTVLRLPLTSVLLTVLVMGDNGIQLTPIIIIAAIVAYVLGARLSPSPHPAASSTPSSAPVASGS